MTTPTANLSANSVNFELGFARDRLISTADNIVRRLTGNSQIVPQGAQFVSAELANKAGFDGITGPSANSVAGFGSPSLPLVASVQLQATSDIFQPNVAWTFVRNSGTAQDSQITITPAADQRTATVSLSNSNRANTSNASLTVTASLSVDGHVVNTFSRSVLLTTISANSGLVLDGPSSVTATGTSAQTAVATFTATANTAFPGTIRLSADRISGAVLTPTIANNSISLQATAATPAASNSAVYVIRAELVQGNTVVDQTQQQVSLLAEFQSANLQITASSLSALDAQTSGTSNASISLSATHEVPSANVVWSRVDVGDTTTLTPSGNNAVLSLSANLGQARKAVSSVTASLQYANGLVLQTRTLDNLTLRAITHGLSIAAVQSNQVGYSAQTATSTVSASYRAGTFSWSSNRTAGAALVLGSSVGSNSGLYSITAAAASRPSSQSGTYNVRGLINFDGISVAEANVSVSTSAQFLDYAFSLAGATSNAAYGEGADVTPSVVTTSTNNIPGGTVVYTSNTAGVTVVTSGANATVSSTFSGAPSSRVANLTATLRDANNRFVEATSRTITLTGGTFALDLSGPTSVARSGYVDQTAVASYAASLTAGYTLNLRAVRVSGSTASISVVGNSLTLSLPRTVVGSSTASYDVIAEALVSGVIVGVRTIRVSLSAQKLDPNMVLSGPTLLGVEAFSPPAIASADFSVSSDVPSAQYVWAFTRLSGSTANTSSSGSSGNVALTRTTLGSNVASYRINVDLYDNNVYVASRSTDLSINATVTDPQFAINSTDGSFADWSSGSATSTINATSAIPDAVYEFSFVRVSGPVAAISSNQSTGSATISINTPTIGTEVAVYDVSCTLRSSLSGTVVAGPITRRVTTTATRYFLSAESAQGFTDSAFNRGAEVLVTLNTNFPNPTFSVNNQLTSGVASTVTVGSNSVLYRLALPASGSSARFSSYDATANLTNSTPQQQTSWSVTLTSARSTTESPIE